MNQKIVDRCCSLMYIAADVLLAVKGVFGRFENDESYKGDGKSTRR